MRGRLFWSQMFLFLVLAVLTAGRFFSRGMGWSEIWLWWWLGGVVGFLFVLSDRLFRELSFVMHSALFVLVWAFLAVFVVTSVVGGFARGMILGIGTSLVFDLICDMRERKAESWFWQVKKIKQREMMLFAYLTAAYYGVIIWFL